MSHPDESPTAAEPRKDNPIHEDEGKKQQQQEQQEQEKRRRQQEGQDEPMRQPGEPGWKERQEGQA